MRKSFVEYLDNALWKDDGGAYGYGTKIHIYNRTFASNSNCMEAYTVSREPLETLRFKTVYYHWYKESSDPVGWNIDSKSDGELY